MKGKNLMMAVALTPAVVVLASTGVADAYNLEYEKVDNTQNTLIGGVENSILGSGFVDVSNAHWGASNVRWAKDHKLVSGFEDGTFRPNEKLTNAHFAKMIGTYIYGASTITSDTGTHWSDGYFESLEEYGTVLTQGYKQKRNELISRGDVARILGKILKDEDDLLRAIDFMYEKNITTGKPGNSVDKYVDFAPNETLTRVQAVGFLKRVNNLYGDELQERNEQEMGISWLMLNIAHLDDYTVDEYDTISDILYQLLSDYKNEHGDYYNFRQDKEFTIVLEELFEKYNDESSDEMVVDQIKSTYGTLDTFLKTLQKGYTVEDTSKGVDKSLNNFGK